MAKKTLEEKFREIGFWTFGFVFWYLVIAFFLKSSYPIYEYSFNRKDAYEAIKDSLTLAAAFLAPVAALVLFTDWKAQHNKSVDANFFLKLYGEYFEYRFQINSTMSEINKLLNNDVPIERISGMLITFTDSTSKMIQVMSDINEIVGREAYENDFKVLIEDLNGKFAGIKKLMQDLISAGDEIRNTEQLQIQFQGLDADLYKHMKSFLFHARSYYRA